MCRDLINSQFPEQFALTASISGFSMSKMTHTQKMIPQHIPSDKILVQYKQ